VQIANLLLLTNYSVSALSKTTGELTTSIFVKDGGPGWKRVETWA